MADHVDPERVAAARYQVKVDGNARVGVIGDYATVVTPRREVRWPVVVGSAPPRASAFQPRAPIVEQLGDAGTWVLSGGGGTGKSQIAAGVFAASEADLRVWVVGQSRTAVLTGYADAAVRLDLADPEIGPEQLAAGFLGFLAATERTWLVVIDDMTDPGLMKDLWPVGAGRVVVTTRRRDAALSGGGRVVIDVDVYTSEEAVGYLRERLARSGRPPADVLEQAAGVADDLGYLPLGLAQAAAVIIDQDITCQEYRSWFADRSQTLDKLFPADADPDGYGNTVATTWGLAIDAADRIDPPGLARPMAALIAVCDPAGAPETLFTTDTACDYLAGMTGQDPVTAAAARKALRGLDRLSLISHDPTKEPRAVRMHNLTARAIRLQTLDKDDINALVQITADTLVEIWPEIENNPPLSEVLRANVDWVYRLAPDALINADTGVHLVLFRSGQSLNDAGLVAPAIDHYNFVSNDATTHVGPDHPDTLTAVNYLARAYWAAGRLAEAVQTAEKNLADRQRILGPDNPDTLASRNGLGLVLKDEGDLTRAIPLLEATLADRERILGPEHTDTLASRNNLAGAYQVAGNLTAAIKLHEATLADRERILGPDNADTLNSRNNLANAYRSRGDLTRAISLYNVNLAEQERILGPDHPNTLLFRNNLAGAYQAGGDLTRAIHLFETTLTDREKTLGPEHPDTLTSRNNLALAHAAAGDLTLAISLFEATLTERERILGPEHPDTLISRNNRATAYQAAGDLTRAIPLLEDTLADRERILGADHPNTLASRINLASAYQAAGDLDRAIPLFEATLTDMERILGPDHPNTLISRSNLAGAYRAAGI